MITIAAHKARPNPAGFFVRGGGIWWLDKFVKLGL